MKIPFLKNFRRGFATNSSSSHSFVYLKEPVPGAHDNYVPDVDDFDWNDFRLDTIKEKLMYVVASRIGGLWNPQPQEVKELLDEYHEQYPELSEEEFTQALKLSVDHQSRGLIDEEQARDPHVVVFGGNDNDGESWERAEVVRSGLVDWSKSEVDYDDYENLPESDVEARKKLLEQYPYLEEEDND